MSVDLVSSFITLCDLLLFQLFSVCHCSRLSLMVWFQWHWWWLLQFIVPVSAARQSTLQCFYASTYALNSLFHYALIDIIIIVIIMW